MIKRNFKGFTLVEILIALFIFTIISMILVGALNTVINVQAATEKKATQLRETQLALLVLDRDIEQAVDRSVAVNESGEASFIGTSDRFALTRAGFANPIASFPHSSLQRILYSQTGNQLTRTTWDVLDRVKTSAQHQRAILSNIADLKFQYLDIKGNFHNDWPIQGTNGTALPRAILVNFTIEGWGKVEQLYVISAQEPPKDAT